MVLWYPGDPPNLTLQMRIPLSLPCAPFPKPLHCATSKLLFNPAPSSTPLSGPVQLSRGTPQRNTRNTSEKNHPASQACQPVPPWRRDCFKQPAALHAQGQFISHSQSTFPLDSRVCGVTCATSTTSPNAEALSTLLRARPWKQPLVCRDAPWHWATVVPQTDCCFIPQESNPKPSLKSKLRKQMPNFPSKMGKNRKVHLWNEVGRGIASNDIQVFQLCSVTTAKKFLLKKTPTSMFIRILTALSLLNLMLIEMAIANQITCSSTNSTPFTEASYARIFFMYQEVRSFLLYQVLKGAACNFLGNIFNPTTTTAKDFLMLMNQG
ncbi:PREDICTED: uncharacterized protein LOC106897483 [Calidris pugnax]|uniref:uncharacterized protein LOC106897483 n=1 Tax=Calidris pugnax TaxID=198806 RepID=UPI00071E6595|nr:PREDICTED: uncharacterized protein LOC106897483 [Calidris pugnax]XP_014813615.1 PREDICTED: uncharacterized protein LOC106897483 [Calidris pugnax]XP_014813616.1 PREDICTED: uncharacterized protein LOC106897483 [Calidris pugnax]XP_014813617.1 PREDICTED: uncharacterized protein LOC106897483 [Calidris pugnax]XP_014813618.1 PREDICTED: uncharacterized protein LOC106897483 [Calidris pugnax]XP_014813619.1 PREDICTED: uncharacterized protein LOC106897483 [Calidris pugnax]XP_014813620.1 PREDICTED: unc